MGACHPSCASSPLACRSQSQREHLHKSALPNEVRRVLQQSPECLRWNTALSLYKLGMDLSLECFDGFASCHARWRKRGEQGKILVGSDLLARACAVRKSPEALVPP